MQRVINFGRVGCECWLRRMYAAIVRSRSECLFFLLLSLHLMFVQVQIVSRFSASDPCAYVYLRTSENEVLDGMCGLPPFFPYVLRMQTPLLSVDRTAQFVVSYSSITFVMKASTVREKKHMIRAFSFLAEDLVFFCRVLIFRPPNVRPSSG